VDEAPSSRQLQELLERERQARAELQAAHDRARFLADASIALAANKAGFCYGAMGSRLLEWAQNRAPHQ